MTKVKTGNEDWGFYGTIRHSTDDVEAAWDYAVGAIVAAVGVGEFETEGVGLFLDSRLGPPFRRLCAQSS